MKKRLKDFQQTEVKQPEAVKGGDGGNLTAIIIIDDNSVGRG